MTNSILLKNSKTIDGILSSKLKYIDIDYEVTNPKLTSISSPWTTTKRSTVMRNEKAILNAYRLWLQSGHDDYIRNPNFGGMFDNALNDKFAFDPSSEILVQNYLIEQTAEKWPDLKVLSVEAKCVVEKRMWKIKIAIQDKNSGMIMPIDDNGIDIRA